jgi:hypothetical protein
MMMMLRCVILGMVLMALVIYQLRSVFMVRVFPSETIQRIVESLLRQSEYISTIHSPQLALIQSRECQASLYTLIHLVGGGQTTVDALCGIDTERLQNILYFQEKQIQEYLQRQTSK